jgi:hypothetical protein
MDHHGAFFKQRVVIIPLINGFEERLMRPFLPHLDHTAGKGSQFIFHGRYLDSLIKWRLSNEILLVDFRNGLGSHHRIYLNLVFSLIPINIEILALFLMIVVGFFLLFECISLFVDLSLCKDTGLDVNLAHRLQVDIHSVISFSLIIVLGGLLFFRSVHSVV